MRCTRAGWLALAFTGCVLVMPASARAQFSEDFDNPLGPDGHVLYRGDLLYTVPIGSATGGNLVGNVHQNALVIQNYFAQITHDQGGSGYFLCNETEDDGTPSYSGEVWGTPALVPVTPGTEYLLSFYMTNMYDLSRSAIEPYINGQSVGSGSGVSAAGYFTDGNPAHQWQQFVFSWNSGSETTADLSLRNLTSTGYGNDFAIDTIVLTAIDPTPVETLSWGNVKDLYR